MNGTHFLTTSRARTLSLATVFRMSDGEAETFFRSLRWADTDGDPVCPSCGGLDAYSFRRPTGALQFQCRACKKQFSSTTGTIFVGFSETTAPSPTPKPPGFTSRLPNTRNSATG